MGADHPGLIVFVLDQSGSMASDWPGAQSGQPRAKSHHLADILNGAIAEIGARSVKSGTLSPRCDIVLIGYEGSNVRSLWQNLAAKHAVYNGKDIVNIADVVPHPLNEIEVPTQVPDGRGGLVPLQKKVKIWLEPYSGGGTPMAEGLERAVQITQKWLADPNHRDSFPPVVIHVTDGMPANSAGAIAASEQLRQLGTSDGSLLMINIHVPENISFPLAFPVSEGDLPPGDAPAKLLFDMSSTLPSELFETAHGAGLPVKPNSKLMIVNGDAVLVTKLIQWGSSAGQQPDQVVPSQQGTAVLPQDQDATVPQP